MDSLTILALKKAESGGGGGGDITVESLSVSQNGTYTATTGKAYSPVTVAVPQTTVSSLSVTENGTYTATEGTAYSPVTVNVPGGLEYETGTYTPASDIAKPTITFANTHTTRPFCVLFQDVSNELEGDGSNLFFGVFSWVDFTGLGYKTSSSDQHYGRIHYAAISGSSFTTSGTNIASLEGDSSSSIGKFLTADGFMPNSDRDYRYWRAGNTYKWIAVWAPTA